MLRNAALTAAFFALTLPVTAYPLEDVLPATTRTCWERVYDAAHLAAHPAQKVVAVRMMFGGVDVGRKRNDPVPVDLYFNLRKRKADNPDPASYDYRLSAQCRAAGSGLRCVPEWDAGSWRIAKGQGGSLVLHNGGLIANPDNYDAEDIADDAVRIPARPDDRSWRLSPLPAASCRRT